MSVLEKLTEGIVRRDVSKEGQALLEKWEKTGLLEGITNEQSRNGMAVLLENQAKELLREASSMAAGDVEGFASVAFPIVRRVFGGLIANDLVSVQPMSLPSGLIFFLDFTATDSRGNLEAGESIYGGNVVAKGLLDGVDLAPSSGKGAGGFYDLHNGYTMHTASVTLRAAKTGGAATAVQNATPSTLTEAQKKVIEFDPDILAGDNVVSVFTVLKKELPASFPSGAFNAAAVSASVKTDANPPTDHPNARLVRRLTRVTGSGEDQALVLTFVHSADAGRPSADALEVVFPRDDALVTGGALGSVVGAEPWQLEGAGRDEKGGATVGNNNPRNIPEIDIKVDSVAVTATTKKLKAKWTPELGQDLNAYHNLDAEVELTGILSEQIALEIDQEILSDLIRGAKAGTRYWSRAPGLFVDSLGNELGATSAAPDFTGTVSEWYETLIETINDVSAQIHRKTLRGGANFVVCGPEVANILEFTSGFRASVTADADRGDIGAVKAGSLSKKFDVMVDPYFPRNILLVGRRGNSFLESGYVYAPYVPLQVTPTIFGTEDFVPRKGVMTRYAKKMVRPDMYGLVIVRGLLGEAGA